MSNIHTRLRRTAFPLRLPTAGRRAFTLVEIMIVVAIIALLAAIAVPNFLRARKRAQATRLYEDLRQIDSAIAQYAIEAQKKAGDPVNWSDLRVYVKTAAMMRGTQISVIGLPFPDTYTVDSAPSTPVGTKAALSDVVPDLFWSPFNLQ